MRPPAFSVGSSGSKPIRSRRIIVKRCSHGAVRGLRRPAWKIQTPHRGVATTFTKWLLVLCPILGAFAQDITPTPQPSGEPAATTFEVIVTGSNIPTAEEVGPQPVDTYRRSDVFRLGARSATDFVQKLPVATGVAINENLNADGDGHVEIDLRGIGPRETLVLQDARRLAPVGFASEIGL